MNQCNIRFLIDDTLVAMKTDPWICVLSVLLLASYGGQQNTYRSATTESRDLAAQQQVCPDLLLDL